ncbi:hypothetical protein Tco_1269327, partial [Tanacetum coccineum]
MASESTSSRQSSHISPSSKVKFKYEEGIIAFNNAVALLEHTNDLYHPMLGFLSNLNVDDTADKSLSKASVQPVTQSKAKINLKTKKKKIPPSSKPKSPYKVRVILPNEQFTETKHAKVIVATADATKSLVASELAEEQGNKLLASEAEQ